MYKTDVRIFAENIIFLHWKQQEIVQKLLVIPRLFTFS